MRNVFVCVRASLFLRKTRKGEKEGCDCGAASKAKKGYRCSCCCCDCGWGHISILRQGRRGQGVARAQYKFHLRWWVNKKMDFVPQQPEPTRRTPGMVCFTLRGLLYMHYIHNCPQRQVLFSSLCHYFGVWAGLSSYHAAWGSVKADAQHLPSSLLFYLIMDVLNYQTSIICYRPYP